MKLNTTFDINERVYSNTYKRNVIINNIKLLTYGKLMNKNKKCVEEYEIKFRDPSIMRYEWVDRDDLQSKKVK